MIVRQANESDEGPTLTILDYPINQMKDNDIIKLKPLRTIYIKAF